MSRLWDLVWMSKRRARCFAFLLHLARFWREARVKCSMSPNRFCPLSIQKIIHQAECANYTKRCGYHRLLIDSPLTTKLLTTDVSCWRHKITFSSSPCHLRPPFPSDAIKPFSIELKFAYFCHSTAPHEIIAYLLPISVRVLNWSAEKSGKVVWPAQASNQWRLCDL